MNNSKLIFWSITVALAGFLFGFDTVVISGAEKKLSEMWSQYTLFGSSDTFHGIVVVGSALWGTVLGAFIGAYPTNKLGRKNTLILIGILYTISAIGSALVSDPYTFAFFRFIGGIGVGASTIAAPAYVSEIAPADKRGRLVALYQFNIVFGIVCALISNYLINRFVGEDAWRWMIGAEAIPAIIYSLMVFTIPMSPRWLILKGKISEAKAILQKLHPVNEVNSIVEKTQNSFKLNTAKESIFDKKYRFPLMLVFAIAMFNQFSGINAILYYAPRIFEMAGFNEENSFLVSILLGVVNLVFTLIGLSLIDKFGRKKLMYLGSFGYLISLGLVVYAFASDWLGIQVAVFLCIFIAAHAMSQGAVIWVFISELFPNHLRAQGQSVGSATHWILAAIIPSFIPILFKTVGAPFVFGFFAFMMLLQLLWVHYLMPETKGKSLEELANEMSNKNAKKDIVESII